MIHRIICLIRLTIPSLLRFLGFGAAPGAHGLRSISQGADCPGLDRVLFDEVTAQLKAKAVKVKTGTLVDATIIASASKGDRWTGLKRSGKRLVIALDAPSRHVVDQVLSEVP